MERNALWILAEEARILSITHMVVCLSVLVVLTVALVWVRNLWYKHQTKEFTKRDEGYTFLSVVLIIAILLVALVVPFLTGSFIKAVSTPQLYRAEKANELRQQGVDPSETVKVE